MTTTPIKWKSSFVVNSGFTGGNQTVPQTIGLKNGNILVVWEDTLQGPSPNIDVMGRILDPEGNPIGDPFQVNALITQGPETGPKIVALPDGGFVMAYGGFSVEDGGFIVVQRFNSLNQAVSERFITDDRSSLTAWEITADVFGDYTVTFERETQPDVLSSYSVDIHSITYRYSDNAPGPERSNVAQNTTEDDRLAATDAFSNGHVVTFYTEPDFDFAGNTDQTAEFRIIDPISGALIRDVELDDGDSLSGTYAKDVAVLTGGQFVLVYYQYGFPFGYAFRVVNTETAAVGPHVEIPDLPDANGVRYDRGVHVVALRDGGFFIASLETANVLYGQRYGAYGDTIGARFPIADDVFSFTADMNLASDGRILVTYRNTGGEIAEVILDPRENTIFGTDTDEFGSGGSDVLTTQKSSTTIFGLGGDDTILGQGGNDTIDGGAGRDSLDGGAGNDTYILADLSITLIFLDPFQVIWGYDFITEASAGGNDTVRVRYVSNANSSTEIRGYALDAYVENGLIEGSEIFDLFGNALANTLTGNGAANTLTGGEGNDSLDGGAGNDTLNGEGGTDTAVYSSATQAVVVDLPGHVAAGAQIGTDTLSSIENVKTGSGNDAVAGDGATNVLDGGAGTDTISYYAVSSGVILDLAAQIGIDGTSTDTLLNFENANGTAYNDAISGNAAANVLNGLGGIDTISYYRATQGVTIDLAAKVAVQGGITDTILNFENANGSAYNDAISGNAGANVLDGLGGIDTLSYYTSSQGLVIDLAGSVVVAGSITDTVRNFENVNATSLNDSVSGNAAANVLNGLGGTDTISYYASRQGVTIDLSTGTGISGGVTDTLLNFEKANGSAYADNITGDGGVNVLNGLGGADMLTGGGGFDTFEFRAGLTSGDVIADFSGNGAAAGDAIKLVGFGTAAQGATFTQLDATQWEIHSGLDGHNEIIMLSNGATVHGSDFFFV